MSDDSAAPSRETITQALHACLDDPLQIAHFGAVEPQANALEELDPHTVDRFYQVLGSLLWAMDRTHPWRKRDHTASPSTRHQTFGIPGRRFLGYHAVDLIIMLQAADSLPALYDRLEHSAGTLAAFHGSSLVSKGQIQERERNLSAFVEIAMDLLHNDPEIRDRLAQDSQTQERLVRRVSALQSLLILTRQQVQQLDMARDQILHHLDLYYRVRDVFLPSLQSQGQLLAHASSWRKYVAYRKYQRAIRKMVKASPYRKQMLSAIRKPVLQSNAQSSQDSQAAGDTNETEPHTSYGSIRLNKFRLDHSVAHQIPYLPMSKNTK